MVQYYSYDNKWLKDKTNEELVALYNEGGDQNAFETLLKRFEGALIQYAKLLTGGLCDPAITYEDLMLTAWEQILKVCASFDHNKGAFYDYALKGARLNMLRYCEKNGFMGSAKVSIPAQKNINRIKKFEEKVYNETGKCPTLEEVAGFLGMSPKTVQTAKDAMIRSVSYEAYVETDYDEDYESSNKQKNDKLQIAENIAKSSEEDFLADVDKQIYADVMKELGTVDTIVLNAKYGLNEDEKTLKDKEIIERIYAETGIIYTPNEIKNKKKELPQLLRGMLASRGVYTTA